MLVRWLCLVAAAAACGACSFDRTGFADLDDGAPPLIDAAADAAFADADPNAPDADPDTPDAPPGTPDAPPGTPDGCPGMPLPFDPSNFDRCDVPATAGDWNVPFGQTWVVDTDTGAVTTPFGAVATGSVLYSQSGGPQIRIFAVDDLSIQSGGILEIRGTRPAAIVSLHDIVVDGLLFAGAEGATQGPGGGNDAVCGDGRGQDGEVQTTSADRDAGSGGSGGGYGDAGGKGAKVADSSSSTTIEGMANGNTTITPLRGGCRGGTGGNTGGGLGGGGGGGVQLVATGTIEVNGAVAAPGGGGRGVTDDHSGGGGGGSGGALLFEADVIDVTGVVSANGGGGAEGSRGSTATDPGDDGHSLDDNPAAGGGGISSGGDGGDGAAEGGGPEDGFEGTSSGGSAAGGGGGGGGVGRIHFSALTTLSVTGLVTPADE